MSQTILVAEDSATMRQVVEMAFKGLPFRVVSVEAGEQALQAAYEHRPSVVILDYHLPDRSGMDVCRALRSDPTLRETPVLILGGSYHPFSEEQALQSGCNAVLTKPFKTDDLTGKVTELARNAPQPSAAAPQRVSSSGSSRPRFGPSSGESRGTGRFQRQPMTTGDSGGSFSPSPSGSAPAAPRRGGFNPSPRASSNPFAKSGPPAAPARAPARAPTPTPQRAAPAPAPTPQQQQLSAAAVQQAAAAAIDPQLIDQLVREEVQKAVRQQMLSMVRSVLNDLFKEKILPRLLKYGEERIDSIIATELRRMMQDRVDEALAQLTSE
ncbi:MAG: hypothetical protein CMH57_10280 [Myxococcales bacterium]|nr:hypothetical protein [Myxococcales bacterium]